jgi:hypothetical protein
MHEWAEIKLEPNKFIVATIKLNTYCFAAEHLEGKRKSETHQITPHARSLVPSEFTGLFLFFLI